MHYLFEYYKLILGFVGDHPIFAFFTIPIWGSLLLIPPLFVAYLIDEVLGIVKRLLR